MIGDNVKIRDYHFPPARSIVDLVIESIERRENIFSFSVGGESGSGKSTLSLVLQSVLEERGFSSFIFHMDDYFKLPPKDTHRERVENITTVGPEEVDLKLLQEHLNRAKDGVEFLKKPLVHYRENDIREVIVELKDKDIIIAEGTYTTLLENIDCKIFMLRNYKDTLEERIKRARDPVIPFNEEVLEIEHGIIREHAEKADLLVDKNYTVTSNSDRYC